MRLKTLLLIVGIVLIAAFAVANVEEFTRPGLLNFGFARIQLPLGLVMLLLVIVLLLIFLVTTLYMRSVNLVETRGYAKQLTAQRELADKAEASRFTDLRRYMETQAALSANQGKDLVTAMDRRLAQTEKFMLQRLDQSDNTNAAYWGQHDDALTRNRRPVAIQSL